MSAPAASTPAANSAAPAASHDASSMFSQDISLDKIPASAQVGASSLTSWIEYNAAETDFPIQNLPYGVFSRRSDASGKRSIGVAIGDQILDLSVLSSRGYFSNIAGVAHTLEQPTLNAFMELGKSVWSEVRKALTALLAKDGADARLRDNAADRTAALLPQSAATMHVPASIGDYTDFYSSKYHAHNVGVMFRGVANALQPNWSALPVGYHGRASSVIVSGEEIHRPQGQLQPDETKPPIFGTCKLLDFELEFGAFLGGKENKLGHPLTIEQAHDRIFGFVLLNDWSARDIQKWEYVPLGPFTAKNFATTISPWIVTSEALAPFRVNNQEQVPKPLPYLQEPHPQTYDISLDVLMRTPSMKAPVKISTSNTKYLYWTFLQQLVHHSVSGCNMRAGDLLGSGTISGPSQHEYGSLLELTWRGSREIKLEKGDGSGAQEIRKFIQDGDSIIMRGAAKAENYRIGFGDCEGTILPAVKYP